MSIQDLFSFVYHSKRMRLDIVASNAINDAIKTDLIEGALKGTPLPGKELEVEEIIKDARQFVENSINENEKSEKDFIRKNSELLESFQINVEKLCLTASPLDSALHELNIQSKSKGFQYEQSFMLAHNLGSLFQIKSQIQGNVIDNPEKISELVKFLVEQIDILIGALTNSNRNILKSEFASLIFPLEKFLAKENGEYLSTKLDLFVNRVCSSIVLRQESGSNQININGNVSGSTIIFGNDNEIQTS